MCVYLELREQGGAGLELLLHAGVVEPRELETRLLQLPIHGDSSFVALPFSLLPLFLVSFFFSGSISSAFFPAAQWSFLREETAPHTLLLRGSCEP